METEIKATHTALPWELDGAGNVYASAHMKLHLWTDEDGREHENMRGLVALVYGNIEEGGPYNGEANAEYIVRACNSFPALLIAAEAALVDSDSRHRWSQQLDHVTREQLRAAIAAAKGEASELS